MIFFSDPSILLSVDVSPTFLSLVTSFVKTHSHLFKILSPFRTLFNVFVIHNIEYLYAYLLNISVHKFLRFLNAYNKTILGFKQSLHLITCVLLSYLLGNECALHRDYCLPVLIVFILYCLFFISLFLYSFFSISLYFKSQHRQLFS